MSNRNIGVVPPNIDPPILKSIDIALHLISIGHKSIKYLCCTAINKAERVVRMNL